jgi:heme A synthase
MVDESPSLSRGQRGYRTLAWVVLAFLVLLVLNGDIVQATGSGAGCGETWPRCDGSMLPGLNDWETRIEFSHRVMTFLLSLGFVGLVIGALRWYPRGHAVRRAVAWATVLLVIEIVLGALLVVFGWVEHDASIGRVVVDGIHLVNTFLLLAATALVAWFASGRRPFRLDVGRGRDDQLALTGFVLILLIGISGAINSLADTLYFDDAVVVEETPIASVLVNIRGIHPALAIGGGIAVFLIVRYLAVGAVGTSRKLALVVQGTVWAQFVIGMLNIVLLTPMESQVVHLLAADVLWIAYLFFVADLLAEPAPVPSVSSPATGGRAP